VGEGRLGLPGVKYRLEVWSPGWDRPLRGEADDRRFEGRLAKIVTVEPVGGQSSFAGHLAGLDEGHVLLLAGPSLEEVDTAATTGGTRSMSFGSPAPGTPTRAMFSPMALTANPMVMAFITNTDASK